MPRETTISPVALRAPRERAIAALTEAFARDDLDVEELESRLSRAHTADSPEALDALIADLPVLAPDAASTSALSLVPVAEARRTDTALSIMGSTERRGAWLAPQQLGAQAYFGSTVLDFREARLPVGVVDVAVTAVCGSVEIIVPPELAVEVHGIGVLGSFESVERAPTTPDPDRPLLRVHGAAVMGSVEVRTELPPRALAKKRT